MPKTFNGAIKFPSNFDVQATRPLDDRLVVDSYDDLINGSIAYPYQGMVVNIKGTSELWILKTQGIKESHNIKNWELVTGSGGGSVEGVEQRIKEIWYRLGLTESNINDIRERLGDCLTSSDLEGYVKLEELPDFLVASDLDGYVKTEDLADFLTSSDLDGYLKTEDLDDFLTSSDLDGYVKIEKLEDYIPKTELENLAKKSDLVGYVRFEDVADYITASDVPTKVSEFINDVGYVTGSDIEEVRKDVKDVKEGLGTLTELVGDPGTDDDKPTGIFGEIDELKKIKSSTINEYSIPIMTPAQRIAALSDPNSGFKDDTDYIAVDLGESDYDLDTSEGRKQFIASIDQNYSSLTGETANKTITSVNGTYLDIMMSAIKALQAEVTELRQVLAGGIHSYINKNTAKSATLYNYDKVATDEPLWSLDAEDGGLTEVLSTDVFNYDLDTIQNVFETPGINDEINVRKENEFEIIGKAILYDRADTLFKLTDSKVLTYIVSSGNDIEFELVNVDDPTKMDTRTVSLKSLMRGYTCDLYAINVIISRKVKINNTICSNNYVYVSVMNFENNIKLVEGYLKPDGTLGFNNGTTRRYDLVPDKAYTIKSIKFTDQTLYRLKFYTKYQDFSQDVIPSNPIEELTKYKYNTAHITIRSVVNMDMLNEIKIQLHPNELVWVEDTRKLMIKASNGEVYSVGSGKEEDNDKDNNMTLQQIAESLIKLGIIVDAEYDGNGELVSLNNIKLNDISSFTMINSETDKKFIFTVDPYGNLVGKDMSDKSISEMLTENKIMVDFTKPSENIRGFSSNYFTRMYTSVTDNDNVPNIGKQSFTSDRIRISSFYAPLETDTIHGCSHSFIELENSSPYDFPLKDTYLHFYNPGAIYNSSTGTYSGKVYHLALDGVIKAGSTYLVRGAKHIEKDDDVNCFIKVDTYDKEWYDENGKLVSFEQLIATASSDGKSVAADSKVKEAYRFCLTYGLPDVTKDYEMVMDAKTIINDEGKYTVSTGEYTYTTSPSIFKDARFIDGCSFSNLKIISSLSNEWYVNGPGSGAGITITSNSLYRIMFALDPAKQAFNGFTADDSSRTRYNKATDINIVNLNKEYIGFPNSDEIVPISRYTPKASFENRNVMTDKTQLDFDKPNMTTCSFGIDVYNTRCFNWISCGLFDEFVWMRKKGTSDKWTKFESYKKITDRTPEKNTSAIYRKEFNVVLNNVAYARITNRFPGNNVQFTSHKCIVGFKDYVNEPTTYEYVVGRADKDGNPDSNHTSELYTFTLYPTDYEGRLYQITDQQGFHWVEYQVWAAAANSINDTINSEIESMASEKVFPILLNTGDMTQSGSRINEWLDYYNAGKKLFKHLEQMNCVGNNDLCGLDPRDLGTGNDSDKSNSLFFHYCYCFEVDDNENLVVHSHTGLNEDRFIPSTYYFKTKGILYVVVNSEMTETTCKSWYMLKSKDNKDVSIYTGIEMIADGKYDKTTSNFTPVYETLYSWLNANAVSSKPKTVIVAMHEMPFTVITQQSLTKSKSDYMAAVRNHPTAAKARVGSNTNQLTIGEKRGLYWCSRLLEHFGCKLVIGGHKHTYALSYPIKEKYRWSHNGGEEILSLTQRKPMSATLEDEAVKEDGSAPEYVINWLIPQGSSELDQYYGASDVNKYALNTTKTPYIPYELYSVYGESAFGSAEGIFRCCTPVKESEYSYNGDKYDGFVNYSMCQATGYKLKSNKELPSKLQVFSKIIPQTTNGFDDYGNNSDKPNGNQLYPMYSVIEINYIDKNIDGGTVKVIDNINVRMRRVTNIFQKNGEDKFDQGKYGKNKPGLEELYSEIDLNSLNTIPEGISIEDIYLKDSQDKTDNLGKLYKSDGKIYECIENKDGNAYWKEVVMNMYGYWTNKATGTYLNIKY